MFESLTGGMLASYGLIGVSVLVIVGTVWAAWPRREKRRDIDVEAAVRNAPYHLLYKRRKGDSVDSSLEPLPKSSDEV